MSHWQTEREFSHSGDVITYANAVHADRCESVTDDAGDTSDVRWVGGEQAKMCFHSLELGNMNCDDDENVLSLSITHTAHTGRTHHCHIVGMVFPQRAIMTETIVYNLITRSLWE